MKRALVLSGGGSRGAYEIGAWQGLIEQGVRLNAVYGTSVGAINAALIAQGDFELASRLWDEINLRKVIAGDDEHFSVERMIGHKRDILPFILENAKHLQVDIAPLERQLTDHLDENRVRASGMELGIMTVRVPQMQPAAMRLGDMRRGSLIDWTLASASCFPVFPMRKIDNELYIDGGCFDNLPIDMAIADGADEIVAIDIHPEPTHPEYAQMPFLKMIHPRHNLGGFLDFAPSLLKRMKRMGYYDAMKSYGALEGVRYTFSRRDDLTTAAAAREYTRRVARFDAETIRRVALRTDRFLNAPLISALTAETPGEKLTWKQTYLRGLELCALAMDFREDAIYDPDALTARIRAYAASGDSAEELDERAVRQTAREGSRALVSLLYRHLTVRGDFAPELLHTLADYPTQTAAALYLAVSR